MTTPRAELRQIWTNARCEPAALERVASTGADPMLPTDVKIGTAATAVIAAAALAYRHAGPWRERRGCETLIQSVGGLAHEQGFGGGLDRPQHLPAQVVDHATGYLAAFGALVALARRAREGGSYLVP